MAEEKSKNEGVTLTQMLKVLDKNVASGIDKKLKKLSRKKALEVPLDKNKASQIERKAAYKDVSKEISSWEPTVEQFRRAKHVTFPLDQEPDLLPSMPQNLEDLKPINDFEREIHDALKSDSVLPDNKELSKAEEKYLKAISAEEAQERHRELQRMRVLLSSYAAKMRRQKAIKSKSYRRLLKQDRIRKHVKKVESDKDLLVEEIDRLKRLRAQERASLKHKNTGKWAKHAKFRAKYDEEARKVLLEQIGISKKLLEKPAESESDSESDDGVSCSSDDEASSEDETPETVTGQSDQPNEPVHSGPAADRLVISSDLIANRSTNKRKASEAIDDEIPGGTSDVETDEDGSDGEQDGEQRKLMSEAFADDDVVAEFKKTKELLAGEEQPKDINLFLPGWGDWAGPGIKINKKKRSRYIIKAKKIPRRDDNLGNVIISEQADDKIKELMVKKLPHGIQNDKQLEKIITRPISATFVSQAEHRELVMPRVQTKMGARIEPIGKKVAHKTKAKWV